MKICPVHKSNTFIKVAVKWNAFSDALLRYLNIEIHKRFKVANKKLTAALKKGKRSKEFFPTSVSTY